VHKNSSPSRQWAELSFSKCRETKRGRQWEGEAKRERQAQESCEDLIEADADSTDVRATRHGWHAPPGDTAAGETAAGETAAGRVTSHTAAGGTAHAHAH
jgi:hypothetical protein